MPENVSETAWQRALSDTNSFISDLRFWLFDTILTLTVGGSTVLALIQWGPDHAVIQATAPFGAALAWLLIGAGAILGWNLIRAPYRLLNETRSQLASGQNDVDRAIEKLRSQTATSDRDLNMADMLNELGDRFAGAIAVPEINGIRTAQERDR